MCIQTKINTIKKLTVQINNEAGLLLGSNNNFFKSIYLELVRKDSYEYTFIRAISWFYILYFESSGVNLDFLKYKLENYGYSNGMYLNNIHAIRTYYQHNLNPQNAADLDKINIVSEYFDNINDDSSDERAFWHKCVFKLYNESILYLENILEVLKQINNDTEFRSIIVKDWKNKQRNYLGFEQVRKIVKRKCEELDLTFYNYKRLSQKNYEKWMTEVKDFDKSISLEDALSKVIEKELIGLEHLPVNGDDIIEHFQISEGEIVGDYLAIAQKEFKKSPCNKKELLKRISNNF